jgi:ATP-dependent DNA helicase RecQ
MSCLQRELTTRGGSVVAKDILGELGLTPEDVLCVSARLRDRVVHFLLRWNYHEALDACLTELLEERVLLSLLDARAQMLLDQGLLDEAWETVSLRQERSASVPSRVLAARICLARGDVDEALVMAKVLLDKSPDRAMAWAFLGEVRLAMGDPEAALAAYRRVDDLSPGSRTYLLGMMAVYQARGDWVSASAYAVRVQESATAESPLPVSYLRRLRDYFEASKERNRLADIDMELDGRSAEELADLQQAIEEELGRTVPHAPVRVRPQRRPSATPARRPEGPLDSFGLVEVPPQDRERHRAAAQRMFGFSELLPGQAEIMTCADRGEDVLAVLPTGGGKSLCYQLPALAASSRTTLVISPLIALMKDQVDKLPPQVRGRATTINSTLEGDELRRRLKAVKAGRYRLVYAAPERLRQPPFVHALRRAGINRLVIDEVHCVSMWGHDFRPDYLYLPKARELLGKPSLLAMTATAAPRVRQDILQRLGQMRTVSGEVMRPNLRLEVFRARGLDDKLRYLLEFCVREPGPGIVYAGTRARCEEVAELLRSQGVSAVHYHAGIPDRNAVQDEFMQGRAQVVVATVAFGMGIDKSDIRFIVHFGPPPSLESYYQEAGRAGRDGLAARCVLMYSPADRATLTARANRDALGKDFLRQVYAAVQASLRGARSGRLVMDNLRRDLLAEEVPLRVALSLLEQVGLLRRWPDVPRSVTLQLKRAAAPGSTDWTAFSSAARLVPGQRLERDLLNVAEAAGLDARCLEEQILQWADAGLLECRASARDVHVELLPAPPDAAQRVDQLLEQYEQIQRQRIAEIVGYGKTGRCRHGHISAYLGGRTIDRCESCDNCRPRVELRRGAALPDERTQLRSVLHAAAPGWGRRNLCHILRGSNLAPPGARDKPGFGALAFRSEAAISRMVDGLIGAGLLEEHELSGGRVFVEPTERGRKALNDDSLMQALVAKQAKRTSARASNRGKGPNQEDQSSDGADVPDDDPLLRRLREWRLEKAREEGVSAFVVAHNSVLRNIVAARPRNERELLAVKGIGPCKMERYGSELLRLLNEEGQG